jgi:RhtB (resistance to homoserine/threonine) family protein
MSGMWPFLVAVGLLTISPGPDTMLVLRNTLRGGRRDGLRTTAGISAGLLVHATLSALGLSLILVRSAAAFDVVKLAGAAYLVWLGAQSLRTALRPAEPAAAVPEGFAAGRARPLREGLLTNLLNPKVAVFYLAFLPQFIGPGDPVLATSLMLAAIHIAMGLVWLSIVSAAVDRAQRFVTRGAARRWLHGACGVVLVGLGLRLALARR